MHRWRKVVRCGCSLHSRIVLGCAHRVALASAWGAICCTAKFAVPPAGAAKARPWTLILAGVAPDGSRAAGMQRRTLELVARSRGRGMLLSALPALVGSSAANFFYITKVMHGMGAAVGATRAPRQSLRASCCASLRHRCSHLRGLCIYVRTITCL